MQQHGHTDANRKAFNLRHNRFVKGDQTFHEQRRRWGFAGRRVKGGHVIARGKHTLGAPDPHGADILVFRRLIQCGNHRVIHIFCERIALGRVVDGDPQNRVNAVYNDVIGTGVTLCHFILFSMCDPDLMSGAAKRPLQRGSR